jgi:homospermidine synthase
MKKSTLATAVPVEFTGRADCVPKADRKQTAADRSSPVFASFDATLLIVGFGAVGQGLASLLQRHIELSRAEVIVLAADSGGRAAAAAMGWSFVPVRLGPGNFADVLSRLVRRGDLLLNLSVEVSSIDLVCWCRGHGVDYLDTCIESWGVHPVTRASLLNQPSNQKLRLDMLRARDSAPWRSAAIVAHGANPGLSSHFLKRALLDLGERRGRNGSAPASRRGWAELAASLEVRRVEVVERDSQVASRPRLGGEFVNTWSPRAFMAEACQPAEVGWGTHEAQPPEGSVIPDHRCASSAVFDTPGALLRTRSWSPRAGMRERFVISLGDASLISDFLAVRQQGRVAYRPTALYAYLPCPDAALSLAELVDSDFEPPTRFRLARDQLISGADELGVLLATPQGGQWFGSHLTLARARQLAPDNNATTLQVAAGVLGALAWLLRRRPTGLFEACDLPHDEVLEVALRYLGDLVATPASAATGTTRLRWSDGTGQRQQPSSVSRWTVARPGGRDAQPSCALGSGRPALSELDRAAGGTGARHEQP